MKTVREIIFQTLWKGFCAGYYIEDILQSTTWKDPRDQALAYEICCGTIRYWNQLQWVAEQLTPTGKLSLKNREKSLLFPALYQIYYLERVPHYAVIDETVKLAKKHCHASVGSFLNGVLRKASQTPLTLPNDHSVHSLSIRYSQTPYFVEQLIQENGEAQAIEILIASNTRPRYFVRSREDPFKYSPIESGWDQTEGYIQNPTPGMLVKFLAEKTPKPATILDLCASPGGKLLLAHDLYPNARLWANDVSESRMVPLKENLSKFGISADLQVGLGENYPTTTKFDLIILDVPCTNSGVFNKRVEARWRISNNSVNDLKVIQERLINHAAELLTPTGCIWFMTCSILESENKISGCSPRLKKLAEITHFPSPDGTDGGYGCVLTQADSSNNL